MASLLWKPGLQVAALPFNLESSSPSSSQRSVRLVLARNPKLNFGKRISCLAKDEDSFGSGKNETESDSKGLQLYRDIERLLTETVKQSQGAWDTPSNWTEVEGAWVLRPRSPKPIAIVHFIGGMFVGAAPQLTYRLFLECLAEKGILVVATPYPSGFDYFLIADEAQFKFDRCLRAIQSEVQHLPIFGIGHSLGSVIHLLIGSRYAVQSNGNVLMSFNNKEASVAIPLFSPVLVPMAQRIGPLLSQTETALKQIAILSSPLLKQLDKLSPPVMKQVLPLVEQLPPLYMDLVNGRENFNPRPEETKQLIKSYYGIARNLLIKFKDDMIDETLVLAQLLSSESSISSILDLSIRSLPGDHVLPLQQIGPDIPQPMADAVNRGGEFLANLYAGTPLETVAKEMSSTLGADPMILRADVWKDLNILVNLIVEWIAANTGRRLTGR